MIDRKYCDECYPKAMNLYRVYGVLIIASFFAGAFFILGVFQWTQ